MKDVRLHLLYVLAENYLRNPFFTLPRSASRPVEPLLHQTELVARALLINPTRILIADTIGLGKTVEALRILYTLNMLQPFKRVLIVVPTVLEKQWMSEMERFGIKAKNTSTLLEELKERRDTEGYYVVRMDTVKKREYINEVRRVAWDAIIVDEAHRLAPRILREEIAKLARDNPNATVLLLSATPHRGDEKKYLYLLSILDPDIEKLIPRERKAKPKVGPDFYAATHTVLVHRRTKEDINSVYEQKELFKPAVMLSVLIEPTPEEQELLKNLVALGRSIVARYYRRAQEMGMYKAKHARAVSALLSMLLIKRGTSSPQALVETFTRITSKRAGEVVTTVGTEIKEALKKVRTVLRQEIAGEGEVEPDKVFNELADVLQKVNLLRDEEIDKLQDSVNIAKRLISDELRDSKIEFLVRLVELAKSKPGGVFSDLGDAKILVFTEFKDTAYYVYSKLKSRLGEGAVRILTSDNRDEHPEVVKWLEKPGVKVLVATDVMSEGLNLQAANVLVNYEVVYSPVRLEQRVGRVWRYGQKKTVYVFNLFLLNTFEEKIQRIFFSKVYNIVETVGKQELELGEEAYLVTFRNTIFDETIKRKLGESSFDDLSRYIGALPLTRVLRKEKAIGKGEKRVHLEEVILRKLIDSGDEEYAELLEKLAERFVGELVEIAKRIKMSRVYPGQASRQSVENALYNMCGIKNHEKARELAKLLLETYCKLVSCIAKPENPVDSINMIVVKTKTEEDSSPTRTLYFAVNNPGRRVYVLYRVAVSLGNRTISDLVGVDRRRREQYNNSERTIPRGCSLSDATQLSPRRRSARSPPRPARTVHEALR
ncbi:MAG: SNF2-related protein [Desulfurococcaceae archaeon]